MKEMENLCRIRDIQRAVVEFEQTFEKFHDISLNEGMLLCSLTGFDMLSSGEISELLGLTCSNASKVIKSVECKGFVQRVVGKKDKRQMYFSLTDMGSNKLYNIKNGNLEIPDILKAML